MTSNVRFTKGPWFASEVMASGDWTVRAEAGSRPVARITDVPDWHDKEADARLIAAAPDLLDVVKQLIDIEDGASIYLGHKEHLIKQAREVLARLDRSTTGITPNTSGIDGMKDS